MRGRKEMKILLLVLCLTLPAITFAGKVLTERTDCVVESTPTNIQGKCQLVRDDEGTTWLIFWDDTKKIRFIRTSKNGGYHYIYQRKLGIPV